MRVRVFSTSACPYCKMVKDFLRQNKIDFEDINVEKDQKAATEMIEKSGQMGVPVIEIDGKIIVGFNLNAIKAALKMR